MLRLRRLRFRCQLNVSMAMALVFLCRGNLAVGKTRNCLSKGQTSCLIAIAMNTSNTRPLMPCSFLQSSGLKAANRNMQMNFDTNYQLTSSDIIGTALLPILVGHPLRPLRFIFLRAAAVGQLGVGASMAVFT